MKLSKNTVQILENLRQINSGLMFTTGSVLYTISPAKNILAEATVEETFPRDFGIYDLSEFLGVVSLFDDADLEFKEQYVQITGLNGRIKAKYRYADKELIVSPPNKKLTLKSEEIKFKLPQDDLAKMIKVLNTLQSPQLAIESDGAKIYLSAFDDQKGESANMAKFEVAEGDGTEYKMVFKPENLKFLPGDYDITISSKGLGHFYSERIQYWLATESISEYKG